MKSVRLLMAAVAAVALWSCGRGDSTEVWQKDRDNVVKIEVVSIEDSLPPMHLLTYPDVVVGDTLIFYDMEATDLMFTAYNAVTGQTLGRFGIFGAGPGEISNVGSIMIDAKNRILYCRNSSQWNYVGFELDKAIGDPYYKAFVKLRHTKTDDKRIPSVTPTFINDSTVINVSHVPNEDRSSFELWIGKLNLRTGETKCLSNTLPEEGNKYHATASEEQNLIVALGRKIDYIALYDLEGNLKRSIYGPEYDKPLRKGYYQNAPVITDRRIFVAHSKKGKRGNYGKEIVELDLDGNYIRTLDIGIPIVNMVYHKKTNRLYFGSTSEPQFGYIQLGN